MSREPLNRRNFNKLSVAALSGLTFGSMVGCGKPETTVETGGEQTAEISGPDCWLSGDKNICRGLNVCAEYGQGEHTCAGTGTCATNVTEHGCAGHNECACEGGCGQNIGENACKGKGGCAVPIENDGMWKKAREKFEAAMKDAGKEFGEAPPAAG